MKRLLFLLAITGCAGAPPPAVSSGLPLGSGVAAADHPLVAVGGEKTTIAAQKGPKGTLVVFTCNHCPWARAWAPRLIELGNTYREQGIGVIAISPNDPKIYPDDNLSAMEERSHRQGMKFVYALDESGVTPKAYAATKTPEVFLFDAAGKLVYHGAIDDNAYEPDKVTQPYLRNALDAVVAGKTPALQSTKALGCAIQPPKGSS